MFRRVLQHIRYVVLVGAVITVAATAVAQTPAEQQQKLQELRGLYKVLAEQQQSSAEHVQVLQQQIAETALYLNQLSEQKKYAASRLAQTQQVVTALQTDLAALKAEYAKLLQQLQKQQLGLQELAFMFSSNSLSQAIARMNYINQYRGARVKQIEHIAAVEEQLTRQLLSLQQQQEQIALNTEQEQTRLKELQELKKEKERVTKRLLADAEKLRQQVEQQQQVLASYSAQLEQLVTTQPSLGNGGAVSFISRKGTLPWPVEQGVIVSRFGRHPHPVLPKVFTDNLGVTLQAVEQQLVKAVASGRVRVVTRVPGMQFMVMVQHDNYFTAYAYLGETQVRNGERVNAGDVLGVTAADEHGLFQLQFQVWKGKQKLNPELWLVQKF